MYLSLGRLYLVRLKQRKSSTKGTGTTVEWLLLCLIVIIKMTGNTYLAQHGKYCFLLLLLSGIGFTIN